MKLEVATYPRIDVIPDELCVKMFDQIASAVQVKMQTTCSH
jgi:hypothetical protein